MQKSHTSNEKSSVSKFIRKGKNLEILIILSFVIIVCLLGFFFYTKNNDNPVVAKVDNIKIRKSEITEKLRVLVGSNDPSFAPDVSTLPDNVIEAISKQIFLEKRIDKRAKRSKAASAKDTVEKIEESKKLIIRRAFLDSIGFEQVSKEELEKKYSEFLEKVKGKNEYLISIIAVKDKKLAQNLSSDLSKKGFVEFVESAKKNSTYSALINEKKVYVPEDMIDSPIANVLKSAKKSSVLGPVHIKDMFYIIRYEDSKQSDNSTFEPIKNQIKEQLAKEALNKYILEITNNAKVRIFKNGVEVKRESAQNTDEKGQDSSDKSQQIQ